MIVDILVIAVLLISALIAFLRGFIREVLTITGVVGGLAAAYFGGPLLTPYMRDWFGVVEGETPERLFGVLPYDIVADALSYGAIFIVVVILLSVLSHFLAETARNIGLGAVDRTLGFIFGILRGILVLGLLYLPIHLFVDKDAKAEWFKSSKTHFYLEKTADSLASFIPESAVEKAEKDLERIEEASETRKKLEEINLLKSKDEEDTASGNEPTPEQQDGYDDRFRENMDQLFEDKNESFNE